MPAFEFNALTADGRSEKGVLQADTARAARSLLRDRGLNPLAVREVDAAASVSQRGASSTALALMARQLATLVGAGLPIDEALSALADGSEGRVRTQVMGLRARVLEGASLAEGMADFPRTFPPMFRASVAAGEQAGRLPEVLRRLADHAEQRDALRRKLIAALAYPLLLSTVAIAVVVALLVWVVPQVIDVFNRFDGELPLATRLLLAISDGMQRWGLPLLLVIVAAVVVVMLALRQPAIRERWQAFLLRLPLLGRLLRAADSARFVRTLALLGASAVPLLDALKMASDVVLRLPIRRSLDAVAARVREGMSLAEALERSGQFPPLVLRLVASGERAGRLNEMLDEAADQQERELDARLGIAAAALGPGMILLIGGLVLFIVLAILLPIFQLNSLIR